MFFITVIYIEYENENDEEQEKEFDNMIESILKDIEKEEFEEKNALLKIKSDVEEKMKKAKSSSERQMILMNMQTNNMEELTGYAKQIKKEQDEFYEKHAEIIKNLRQKELKGSFRYYFTRYERNRRRYF